MLSDWLSDCHVSWFELLVCWLTDEFIVLFIVYFGCLTGRCVRLVLAIFFGCSIAWVWLLICSLSCLGRFVGRSADCMFSCLVVCMHCVFVLFYVCLFRYCLFVWTVG